MKKKQAKKAARKVSKGAKRVAPAAPSKKPASVRPPPRSLQHAFIASDREARQARALEEKHAAARAASAVQPTRKPSEIKVGKRFRTDKGDIAGLAASIDARGGLLQPICVDVKTGELIDGERRLIAWGKSRYAGSPIPVFPVSIDSIIAGEWDANAQRKDFTYSEAVAIKRAIEGKLHAMANQRTGRKGEGAGRAADQASLFVGKKRRSLEKAEQVIEAAEADPERFGKLKEQMDRTGRVDGSFKRLQNIKRGDELRATPPCVPMNGPYHTAAIDLPWPADLGGRRDQESRGYYPYATMSMEQLVTYAREQIAPVLHADCAIWLWIPNFHLVRGCHVEILQALGAEGSTMLTWAKPVMGQGQRLRGATEHAILAIRGDVPVLGASECTWFEAPPSDPKHSAKPVDFFRIVEKVTPAPRYAYFFAPGAVPENWDGHGDRIGKAAAEDARAAEQKLPAEVKSNAPEALPPLPTLQQGDNSPPADVLACLSAVERGEGARLGAFAAEYLRGAVLIKGKRDPKLTKFGSRQMVLLHSIAAGNAVSESGGPSNPWGGHVVSMTIDWDVDPSLSVGTCQCGAVFKVPRDGTTPEENLRRGEEMSAQIAAHRKEVGANAHAQSGLVAAADDAADASKPDDLLGEPAFLRRAPATEAAE